MKITPSLKLYFIAMIFVSGVSTVIVMSAVSMHYFFQGIDFSMIDSMRSQVHNYDVQDGKPVNADRFVIATQWKDLPQPIKDNLDEKELKENRLLKLIDGYPLFGEPNAGYFAMKVLHNGEDRYISSMFSAEFKHHSPTGQNLAFNPPHLENGNDRPNQFIYIIIIGLIGILIFSLLPYFVLRRVTAPVEKLMFWAKELDKDKLGESVPDFHYSELNSLATMMQESLQSVQEALVREQRFLGYASHELRTPIAVTRTNTELLQKMMTKNINVEKQKQVVQRIERACYTMTDLTETLLWLNRQPDKLIPLSPLKLGVLTQQIIEDLSHIHDEGNITLHQTTDQSSFTLPEPLCRIIITNLIRNAFQHTQQGSVTIKQFATTFTITNQNTYSQLSEINKSDNGENKSELGFGLGLELTKRLVEHYGWNYKNVADDVGHHVEINFY